MNGLQLIGLKERIAKSFTESNWMELGLITGCLDIVESDHRLLRSLSFSDPDYEGRVIAVLRKITDKSEANLGIVVSYLDDKFPPLGISISSHNEKKRQILFSPEVFKVPEVEVNPLMVSVMMPFTPEFEAVFAAIKVAAVSGGYSSCLRVKDMWEDSAIIQDIFAIIFESSVVVCDFSGQNPNVFYEAGIAHTLGKHVIPITQHKKDVPFDVGHHRYIEYLKNIEGLQDLTTNLSQRFITLEKRNVPPFPY